MKKNMFMSYLTTESQKNNYIYIQNFIITLTTLVFRDKFSRFTSTNITTHADTVDKMKK